MSHLHQRHDEIARLVNEGDLNRATARLQDFARDFCAQSSADAAAAVGVATDIRRRYNLLRAAAAAIASGADPRRAALSAEVLACAERVRSDAEHTPLPYPLTDLVCVTQSLEKTYRRATGFHLKPIDLSMRFGELTAVVGENGNGKSTLIKLIVGALMPSGGTLTYPYFGITDAAQLNDPYAIRQRIAYIPQDLPRWNGAVTENLLFTAVAHGLTPEHATAEAAYAVSRLGLDAYAGATWHELSGGFRMRFALARALVVNPSMLVLDEPLANLDVNTQLTFLQDLRNLTSSLARPLSVLVSSQHLHEIESISDRVIFLKAGRAIYNGTRAAYGANRAENVFECSCAATKEQLADALAPLAPERIDVVGANFIVVLPVQVTANVFLRALLAREIGVGYFRDISESTRKLFDRETA